MISVSLRLKLSTFLYRVTEGGWLAIEGAVGFQLHLRDV